MTIVVELILFVVTAVLLLLMAVEDLKSGDVSERLCYLCGCVVGAMLGRFIGVSSPFSLAIAVVLIALFFSNLNLPVLGDADLFPLALALLFFWRTGYITLAMLYAVVLLCVTVVYAIWYKIFKDRSWKFGAMKPVPALPIFFWTWFISGSIYFLAMWITGGIDVWAEETLRTLWIGV